MEDNAFAFSLGHAEQDVQPQELTGLLEAWWSPPAWRRAADGSEDRRLEHRREGSSLGAVSFEEATARGRDSEKALDEGLPASARPVEHSQTQDSHAGRLDHSEDLAFSTRKRVFSDNRLPEKKGKSSAAAHVDYLQRQSTRFCSRSPPSCPWPSDYTRPLGNRIPRATPVEWIEGVAIISCHRSSSSIVGSLNDYQKERQFAKLNRKKQDRHSQGHPVRQDHRDLRLRYLDWRRAPP